MSQGVEVRVTCPSCGAVLRRMIVPTPDPPGWVPDPSTFRDGELTIGSHQDPESYVRAISAALDGLRGKPLLDHDDLVVNGRWVRLAGDTPATFYEELRAAGAAVHQRLTIRCRECLWQRRVRSDRLDRAIQSEAARVRDVLKHLGVQDPGTGASDLPADGI